MMNVLITGGAGYLGVLLAKALMNEGIRVTIYDNFLYGESVIFHLLDSNLLRVIRGDVRSLDEKDVKDYDVIYHLAGISSFPACEANSYSAKVINLDATQNLARCTSKSQAVVYAATTSSYGNVRGIACDENSEICPADLSLYGRTKYLAEQILMDRGNSVSLRFPSVFGVSPKMRNDLMVNDFTFRAVSERCIVIYEGKSKRTFLHVKDAIRALVYILAKIDQTRNEIYNVGDDKLNYSKTEIAEHISKHTKCAVISTEMSDVDARDFNVSFEKIRMLGFFPKFTLNDGICELVNLYRFYPAFSHYRTI